MLQRPHANIFSYVLRTKFEFFSFLDGYSTDDIRYEWEGTKSEVHVEKEAKFLPQYNVSKFVASMADPKMYVAGKCLIS